MPANLHRVVALLPSATEIVCALGQPQWLVGRSHECDYPPEIRGVPVCTRSRIDSTRESAALHAEVEAKLKEETSLYEIDAERLRSLKPDIILTQGQCEVCAVSEKDVEMAVKDLRPSPRVVVLSPRRLMDLWQDILTVSEALDVSDDGRTLVKQLKNRLTDVLFKTAPLRKRPSVVCMEWLDPIMAAGNWVPELVEMAGGKNLLSKPGEHSGWLKWEELVEADPDIIILMPCGFTLARTGTEGSVLTKRREWNRLRAVKRGNVYAVDGSQYFNRPGPRLVDSIEILAEILHANLFPSRFQGSAWRRVVFE